MSLLQTDFNVEDGTGQANSTSYVNVQESKNYLNNVSRPGLDSFVDDTDQQIQSYLNSATLYIDETYCFKGSKVNDTQALAFPRQNIDQNGVPLYVKYATIEVALMIKNAKIYASPGGETTGEVIERKVGPITTKFARASEKSRGSRQTNLLKFVEELLDTFLTNKPGENTFVRG